MVIAFDYPSIDAGNVNFRHYRRFFGMLPVDVDLAVELGELSVRGPEELVNGETDRRAG